VPSQHRDYVCGCYRWGCHPVRRMKRLVHHGACRLASLFRATCSRLWGPWEAAKRRSQFRLITLLPQHTPLMGTCSSTRGILWAGGVAQPEPARRKERVDIMESLHNIVHFEHACCSGQEAVRAGQEPVRPSEEKPWRLPPDCSPPLGGKGQSLRWSSGGGGTLIAWLAVLGVRTRHVSRQRKCP